MEPPGRGLMSYYFGYGSNLATEDLQRWCQRNNFAQASFRAVETAWLPDYAPSFHYYSPVRGGGALDVTPALGHCTPGVLFELNEVAERALDQKEGVGQGRYGRRAMVAITANGRALPCWTYRVDASFVEPQLVAPTPYYLEIVKNALRRHGLNEQPVLAAARGNQPSASPDRLFVYGTLKRGHCRAGLLKPRTVEPAQCRGHLVDLGEYPGLRLGAEPARDAAGREDHLQPPPGWVRGELVEHDGLGDLLPELDEVEDFLGYDHPDSLYRRVLIRVRTGDGSESLAWSYSYLGPVGPSTPVVPGGDWRGDL